MSLITIIPSINYNQSTLHSTTLTHPHHRYKKCFDSHHFLGKIYPYTVLSFLSLWDCQLIALLPWRYSEFAEKSRGFPDMLTLRTTSYYKIAQDLTRFACNVIYLLNAVDEAADASVEVMTYFNMAASVATIVLAGMVAVMKNSVLMEVEAAAESQFDDDGRRSSHGRGGGGAGASAIEMMEAEGGGAAWASNPMHDDSTDPSTIFVRNPPGTSVRTLIVQLLPDIDGPSLHAVGSAFKDDGVSNLEELRTYLEAGLIGIPELKQYASKGNLEMTSVMALVTALKPFISTTTSSSPSSAAAAGGGKGTEGTATGSTGLSGVVDASSNSAVLRSTMEDVLRPALKEISVSLGELKKDIAVSTSPARTPDRTPVFPMNTTANP